MPTPRSTLSLLLAATIPLMAGVTMGQDFPNKPVRIFASVGGGGDFAARLIAQGLTTSLGQQVIVENRGGGVVAGEIVARSPPDGYTLLYYGNTLWLLPLMRDHVPYDPLKDFAPVTLTVRAASMLIVHPSLPAKSLKELIALARSRPGQINYGSAAAGSSGHLSAELFKAMTGVNIVRITYKGVGPAVNAVISGEVELSFPSISSALPHVKSGRLKALAVTSAQPSALAPELPTMAVSGVPGYETGGFYGVFAPAGTPPALVARLHQHVLGAISKPDLKEKFLNSGVEVIGGSPEQLAAAMRSEIAVIGKVIKDAGIRDQ